MIREMKKIPLYVLAILFLIFTGFPYLYMVDDLLQEPIGFFSKSVLLLDILYV